MVAMATPAPSIPAPILLPAPTSALPKPRTHSFPRKADKETATERKIKIKIKKTKINKRKIRTNKTIEERNKIRIRKRMKEKKLEKK